MRPLILFLTLIFAISSFSVSAQTKNKKKESITSGTDCPTGYLGKRELYSKCGFVNSVDETF